MALLLAAPAAQHQHAAAAEDMDARPDGPVAPALSTEAVGDGPKGLLAVAAKVALLLTNISKKTDKQTEKLRDR